MAALLTLEGMVNKQVIVQGIMNPIMHATILDQDPVKKFEYIRDNTLATVDQAEVDTYDAAMQKLMNGFALLAIDGCIRMMAFSVQGFFLPRDLRTTERSDATWITGGICRTVFDQYVHDPQENAHPKTQI